MAKGVTGITVCCNTKYLIEKAYNSIRKFHPDMPIIIIDGSDADNSCASYVRSLVSDLTIIISLEYNIGHGRGMCMGIDKTKTPYALIFDSDIEMIKSPIKLMLEMMEEDTFGVGCIERKGFGRYEDIDHHYHIQPHLMPYLHPYFHLININNYKKYHSYLHHGAPCYLTMLDIYNQGLSERILKQFTGLDSAKDESGEYVRHSGRGTRDERVKRNFEEIEGEWEYK